MKKTLTIALVLTCGVALAQKTDNVGIGTTRPDPSAILDLSSTNKGLLLPRMTEAQRNAIKNPAAGLVVYQIDQMIGSYIFDGTTWVSNARVGAVEGAGAWDMNGNSTADATNFLGVPSGVPITFRIGGVQVGKIIDDGLGNSRVFLGYAAGAGTGTNNIGIGTSALGSNTTGASNMAIGSYSMSANTTGFNNVALGPSSLSSNTTAAFNTAIGSAALAVNTTGTGNLALGSFSLLTNNGDYNTGVGAYSLYSNTIGAGNTAVGPQTMYANITGRANVAVGSNAMIANTNGSNNTAMGSDALRSGSGSGSVAIGFEAARNEINSNMLYISNSSTPNPLLKGSFHSSAPWLRINVKATPSSPAPNTTGYMAIGDFDTAPGVAGAGGLGLPSSFVNGAYRLYVQDGILTEKLKVALRNSGDWADYVFAPEYKLMPLSEVERFIKINKHLPNVPSAEEMVANGLDVSSTSAKLMEKIEELTLYVIKLNEEVQKLKQQK